MGHDPAGHVAAVGSTQHAKTVGVDEVEVFECSVDDCHAIVVVGAAPASALGFVFRSKNGRCPGVLSTRAAARVGAQHHVASFGLHLEFVEVIVAVLRERAAVNVEQCRVFLGRVKVVGAEDPTVDLVAIGRCKKVFAGARVCFGQERRTDRGELMCLAVDIHIELGRLVTFGCRVRNDICAV